MKRIFVIFFVFLMLAACGVAGGVFLTGQKLGDAGESVDSAVSASSVEPISGDNLLMASCNNGVYSGVNTVHETDELVVTMNGSYENTGAVSYFVHLATLNNFQKGKSITLNVEYLGGTVSGGGRVIFGWDLNDESWNIHHRSFGEPNIENVSTSFTNQLEINLNRGYCSIFLWRNTDSGGNPTFNNARFKLTMTYDGAKMAFVSLMSGVYNGVNVEMGYPADTVTMNGSYIDGELHYISDTIKGSNIKSGKNVTIQVEHLGGTYSGGGRVIFGWDLRNESGNIYYRSSREPNVDNNSTIWTCQLTQGLSVGYFSIFLWRNTDVTGTPTFTNAKYRVSLYYDTNILSFNGNGGSVDPSSKIVVAGSKYGELPTPTRTGYSFNNWWTAASGGSRVYSSTTMGTSNATIYAHWTINRYTVSLTAGDNGISSVTGGGVYNYGSSVAVKANVKAGYSFFKWSDNVTSASRTLTISTSNISLTAYTTANTYTVSFNANGGSASTTSRRVTFNSTYGTLPTATRTNYTQNGWWTTASGGAQISSYSTYTTAGNQTLYAHWTPVPITNTVNMVVVSKDGKTTTVSNAGGSVSVQRNVISGSSSSASTTTQTAATASYVAHQGQLFKLTATANSGYVLAGISTSTSTPNPSSPPSASASYYPTSNTTYYVYFKQVSGNRLKYDSTDKYFYFEDGYYPQSEVSLNPTMTNGETFTYNNGASDVTIPVYTSGSDRYVKITKDGATKTFKFESIRWRISDYGVAKTERNISRYTTLCKLANYASYTTNFTAVSDLILSVGAMHNTKNVGEGYSVQDMASYKNIQNTTDGVSIAFNYNASSSIKVDKYSTALNSNTITKTSVNYTSPLRISSLQEIKSVGLVNKGSRASDMVAFLLGVDKNKVAYWTRDLSNLGSGTAITAGGTVVQPWLNQMLGIRFAYTFSEASNVAFY